MTIKVLVFHSFVHSATSHTSTEHASTEKYLCFIRRFAIDSMSLLASKIYFIFGLKQVFLFQYFGDYFNSIRLFLAQCASE